MEFNLLFCVLMIQKGIPEHPWMPRYPFYKEQTFPFYNKNVLAKTVFFCYTLANEYRCNRRMLWKRMY